MPTLAELANIKLLKVRCEECGNFLGAGLLGLKFKCTECGHINEVQDKKIITPSVDEINES
jgi:phage FluMu protein Com